MNLLDKISLFWTDGIGFLEAVRACDPYELAAAIGEDRTKVKTWVALAEVYFGSTNCTKMQRHAREYASTGNLSMPMLLLIETYAKKATKNSSQHGRADGHAQAWRLRESLCAFTGTYEQLREEAKKELSERTEPVAPEASLRVGTQDQGMMTMHYTGPARVVTDLLKTLEAHVPNVAPNLPRSRALALAFEHHLKSGTGLITPTYETLVVIGLDDAIKIKSGAGDEVTLGLSDGTTMTGAEYLNAERNGQLGELLHVGMFHPRHGGVNLYTARHANAKQRMLAMAENLVCPWPDCNVPADRCEVHHLKAYRHGGLTEPSNLSMLCPHHNGANDDDPDGPARRGRMERHAGKVRYTSPGGRHIANHHPVSKLGAMHLI